MGGGLESRCVGRVCGADGAVRRYFMRKIHGQTTLNISLLLWGKCYENSSTSKYRAVLY